MIFYSYLEKEDITYQEMWTRIWKVNLEVGDLDKNKMRAKVMELFEEKNL